MKRSARRFAWFCPTAFLLAGTAYANFSPEPRLTAKAAGGPEELCCLELPAVGDCQLLSGESILRYRRS